ncbi:hypothetical protein BDW42DRAFT_158245 [Aspergillus taichungensis]|uniref:Uncharacterized protein n=1 Tax=Aspergillus taichungensis TaxID=482145 RepID=A0A2J5I9B6_9EURO|nr:hypothetical protein BDW42DRAFT_158245 [Aspergillus taichungensis]
MAPRFPHCPIHPPFVPQSRSVMMIRRIRTGKSSPSVHDLIGRMTQPDPELRRSHLYEPLV